MFEKLNTKAISFDRFLIRLFKSSVVGIGCIIIGVLIGMVGYHSLQEMSWIDAFLNASMILAGMGPVTTLTNFSAKLFAGLYALFSGLLFIALMGIIFAPVIHRFLQQMHADEE